MYAHVVSFNKLTKCSNRINEKTTVNEQIRNIKSNITCEQPAFILAPPCLRAVHRDMDVCCVYSVDKNRQPEAEMIYKFTLK